MKRKMTLLVILLLSGICLLMFAACTGEEGATIELCFEEYDDWTRTSPASVPSSADVMGTYNLTGFLLNLYEDGFLVESIDENSGYPYSGEMVIGVSNVTQDVTFDGENVFVSATYINAPADTWSGVFHIDQGGMLYDINYDIAGSELTTYSGLECVDVSATAAEALDLAAGNIGGLIGPTLYE